MMHAALYVPVGADLARWTAACTTLAEARGWHATTLVRQWEDLVALAMAGHAPVTIVGTRAHLPPDRTPRIEVVDEQAPVTLRPRWQAPAPWPSPRAAPRR